MRSSADPPTELPHLATFRSRGVAVPFTAPLLAGVRVRASRQNDIELVLPNPSGEPGVYILDRPGVRAMCNPTIHDTLLLRRAGCLDTINPAGIRDVALHVAQDGHAGRQALAAAEVALDADRTDRERACLELLVRLIGQSGLAGQRTTVMAGRNPDLERRASAALHRIAGSLGRPATDLARGVMAIGIALAPVGFPSNEARIPRLITRLNDTHTELSQWLTADNANDIAGMGIGVVAAMRIAADIASVLLRATRALAADPMALLKHWVSDPAATLDLITRCDWLLDGWEHPCLLWASARNTPLRRAALLEMAQLAPELPREVVAWAGSALPARAFDQTCRVSSYHDGWRTGASAFALIERNEKLRAMST